MTDLPAPGPAAVQLQCGLRLGQSVPGAHHEAQGVAPVALRLHLGALCLVFRPPALPAAGTAVASQAAGRAADRALQQRAPAARAAQAPAPGSV